MDDTRDISAKLFEMAFFVRSPSTPGKTSDAFALQAVIPNRIVLCVQTLAGQGMMCNRVARQRGSTGIVETCSFLLVSRNNVNYFADHQLCLKTVLKVIANAVLYSTGSWDNKYVKGLESNTGGLV